MCRRELDKSESEIKKNGSIIGEYKQVQTVNMKYFICKKNLRGDQFQNEVQINLNNSFFNFILKE